MSDTPEEKPKEDRKEEEKSDDNAIETCAGGLTEDQVKELQAELDRSKESNSFSSTSRCTIM